MKPTKAGPTSAAAAAAPAAEQVISLYKAQPKIYARAVKGRFDYWRWVFVWLTQIVFYGLPWLSWNDRQAVLFDLASRRFYIFGLVFYPQDFIYLTAVLLVSAYSLFLFTAVAGRLWCGYTCPQTVYTEIFMWVERKLEGDRVARMRLDAGPWTANKLLRKSAKQLAWIAIGLWTGFTFVGYFTPIHTLAAEVAGFGMGSWEIFWVLFYGFATYGNAGFMREQVCKYLCPYARFQSAMFDKDTLIISYDTERGEPRGSRSRKADPKALGLGSCVDCNLCVQVCPTGIDIRQGLQYECIGCAACVDVCDEVMDRVNYPRGLIRYDTQNGLSQHLTRSQLLGRMFRPRIIVYTVILALICIAVAASIAMRSPFKVDVLRDRSSLARQVEGG
jgi:cytochrome c oxidase accessory protein FixG